MATFSPTRLRARRIAAGLTREELAMAVARGALTVSFWERGVKTPYYGTIVAAARALGCDPADLCEPVARRASR